MKRVSALALTAVMALSMAACGNNGGNTTTAAPTTAAPTTVETEAPETEAEETEETATEAAEVSVLSYEEYMAADVDTEVTIEAYVQAKMTYYADYKNANVYLADEDGAYYAYRMVIESQDDYDALEIGTMIRVTGWKAEWAGEVELGEGCTYELVEDADTYTAEAVDVTADLADEDALKASINKLVTFSGLTVVAANDDGDAFLYNWDGSGEEGSDLYFNVEVDGTVYSFTVESDLCDAESDVYQAVKALNVGDTIDAEGFLYWYEGANPHITSVTVK